MYDEEYYEGNASNYGSFGGYGSRKFSLEKVIFGGKWPGRQDISEDVFAI